MGAPIMPIGGCRVSRAGLSLIRAVVFLPTWRSPGQLWGRRMR
jgi:hypothetical protein